MVGSFEGAVGAWAPEAELGSTATVTIVPAPLEQVGIEPNTVEIGVNVPQQFVAVGADRFGNRILEIAATWSVEPESGNIDARMPAGFFYWT